MCNQESGVMTYPRRHDRASEMGKHISARISALVPRILVRIRMLDLRTTFFVPVRTAAQLPYVTVFSIRINFLR